jgi:FtsH-binding integral membrane protein
MLVYPRGWKLIASCFWKRVFTGASVAGAGVSVNQHRNRSVAEKYQRLLLKHPFIQPASEGDCQGDDELMILRICSNLHRTGGIVLMRIAIQAGAQTIADTTSGDAHFSGRNIMSGFYNNEPETTSILEAHVTTRADFIQKTYLHLFGAIVAFILIETYLFQSGLAITLAQSMMGVSWLVVLGGFMVVSWLASRVADTAEGLPAQYAALAAFVVAEALIFVPLLVYANQFAPGAIKSAGITAMIGFTGLTAVAFITKQDFSFLRGLLMWIGFGAILLILSGVIFGFTLGMWFSLAMVVFAGAAILYDTSNVLHHYPEDRYVSAALQLFASVALLFWYILRIFIATSDD